MDGGHLKMWTCFGWNVSGWRVGVAFREESGKMECSGLCDRTRLGHPFLERERKISVAECFYLDLINCRECCSVHGCVPWFLTSAA